MSDINISHGRGGAGNIAPDPNPYADGEIVRQGTPGDQGDGAYSSGRGGAGNIGSPGLKPKKDEGDGDVVPEAAIRQEEPHKTYHVGRGGEGNVVPKTATKPPEPHDPNHPGLKGMVKERLFGGERKRGE